MSKNILEIDSPHCFEENKINLSSEIKCKYCNEPLIGEKYTKPIISVMTAIILGIGGGIYLDGKFEIDRYSINTEYNIIHNCLSSYDEPLNERYYRIKKERCICALKKTENEIDFDEYDKNENKFLDIFEDKIKECIKR